MAGCLALCAVTACGDDGSSAAVDAATSRDAIVVDANENNDATPSLAWVDFTITGCAGEMAQAQGPSADAGVATPTCSGAAPLTLQFTAVAPSAIVTYRWDFAGLEVTDATPVHTFALPGTYDVSLTVGGPGGTAMTTKLNIVVAVPASVGNRCGQDAQCASGECICDNETTCAAGLTFGICSQTCLGGPTCSDGVCIDLNPSNGTGGEEWQQSLCLATCNDDDDCPASLRCRQFHDDTGSWTKACFAGGLLGDIGASCQNAGGTPDDTLCTSGTCLNEGARGVCSESCATNTCPQGSACATFNTSPAGSWCVARCDTASVCETDPWLACEPPGNAGSKGFTVDETVGGATYCAPKSCTGPSDCGPDGACVDSFCTAPTP